MSGIAAYLTQYFLRTEDFAAHCGLTVEAVQELIDAELIPNASYCVNEDGRIVSRAFGSMDAPGAPVGSWFAPANAAWVQLAREAIATQGASMAAETLRTAFRRRYHEAVVNLHANDGPIPGLHTTDGEFDDATFDREFVAVWTHFLAGTFGLCVADPRNESRIASKEMLQKRLAAVTDNGERTRYAPHDAALVRKLIERFLDAAMPFSPIEYPRSSRKKLADDVLKKLA